MKQYEITGLGPLNADGSRNIFTTLYAPFIVTATWLAEQSKAPDVGDVLEVDDAGAMTLVTEAQAITQDEGKEDETEEAQKKSAGVAESGDGSKSSPYAFFNSYHCNPIIIHAAAITEVGEPESDGSRLIGLVGGATKIATPEMMSRMVPAVGDYWIIVPQEGGNYEYLNPKAVFEAKYSLIEY